MMPNVTQPTWPCDYVDYIKNKVLCDDDIYKGENSDEDISSWSEDAIWNHLKNKIYDSVCSDFAKQSRGVLILPCFLPFGADHRCFV